MLPAQSGRDQSKTAPRVIHITGLGLQRRGIITQIGVEAKGPTLARVQLARGPGQGTLTAEGGDEFETLWSPSQLSRTGLVKNSTYNCFSVCLADLPRSSYLQESEHLRKVLCSLSAPNYRLKRCFPQSSRDESFFWMVLEKGFPYSHSSCLQVE